jgi:hypothetical protein
VDLRQPKDPDPSSEYERLWKALEQIGEHGLWTSSLVETGLRKNDDLLVGNTKFRDWLDAHNDVWKKLGSFDRSISPFKDFDETIVTLNDKACNLLEHADGNWEHVWYLIYSLFDVNCPNLDDPYHWSVRELVMGISQQNPFIFFDFHSLFDRDDKQASWLADRFFDTSSGMNGNPSLVHHRPIVKIWIMCLTLFDHPWASEFDEFLEKLPETGCIWDHYITVSTKLKAENPVEAPQTRRAANSGIQKIAEMDEDDSNESEDSDESDDYNYEAVIVNKRGWNEFGNESDVDDMIVNKLIKNNTPAKDSEFPETGGRSDEKEYGKDDSHDHSSGSGVSVKDGDSVSTRTGTVPIVDVDQDEDDEPIPALLFRSREDDDDDSSDDEYSEYDGYANGDNGDDDDDEDDDDDVLPDVDVLADNPGDESISALTGGSAGGVNSGNTDVVMDDTQPDRVAGSGPRPITVADRLDILRQVNMHGVVGQARIYDISLGLKWDGAQAGSDSLATTWLNHILKSLAEALNSSADGLRILPIADEDYKKVKMWIRNEKELHNKIKTFRDLSTYLDMKYGNSPYVSTSNKPGDKKLRSRIRVGFNEHVDPDSIMSYLHTGFCSQGRGTGCYPSPLQFGDIEKIGALCFYPHDANARAIEKDLMRRFQWQFPIGLRLDWVSMPYNGRSKWNERSPGIMLWHIYTRRTHAKQIDRELRLWLHPSTAKKHFPWAAVTHYISDWRAAQNGTISVRAYGPVKDQILQMVSKSRDFQELTTVLYSGPEIHGMLKKAPTRQFGESSFLKLLLSIKATPFQAEMADAADPKDDKSNGTAEPAPDPDVNDMDTDDSDLDDDEDGFKTVKIKKKRKKKKVTDDDARVSMDATSLTPAQLRDAKVLEKKRQLDMDNSRPGPLFLMILPGEMEGTFVLVSRLKFATLARNVLQSLVPFFTHHLLEGSTPRVDRVLRKWISKSAIQHARRRNLVWCTESLRAKDASKIRVSVDEGLEFLDGFGADPTDVFDGSLAFDLDMADAKDIDDGATVAGELDELRETESQLDDALSELERVKRLLAAAMLQQPPTNNVVPTPLAATPNRAAATSSFHSPQRGVPAGESTSTRDPTPSKSKTVSKPGSKLVSKPSAGPKSKPAPKSRPKASSKSSKLKSPPVYAKASPTNPVVSPAPSTQPSLASTESSATPSHSRDRVRFQPLELDPKGKSATSPNSKSDMRQYFRPKKPNPDHSPSADRGAPGSTAGP